MCVNDSLITRPGTRPGHERAAWRSLSGWRKYLHYLPKTGCLISIALARKTMAVCFYPNRMALESLANRALCRLFTVKRVQCVGARRAASAADPYVRDNVYGHRLR